MGANPNPLDAATMVGGEGSKKDDDPTARYIAMYKIFGQMQRPKSVAKDPKMVAIVILLPFFLVKCRCTCKGSNSIMQRVTFLLRHTAPLLQRF